MTITEDDLKLEYIGIPAYRMYKNVTKDQATALIDSSTILEDKNKAKQVLAGLEKPLDIDMFFNRLIASEEFSLMQTIRYYKMHIPGETEEINKMESRLNIITQLTNQLLTK